MSDAAFKSAPYSGYTTMQLNEFIANPQQLNAETVAKIQAEVDRRAKVKAGDSGGVKIKVKNFKIDVDVYGPIETEIDY